MSVFQRSWVSAVLPLLLWGAATAAQDCNTDRFVLLANGQEVLDRSTRLIWQRCHDGESYQDGKCSSSSNRNRFSISEPWRLPTEQELHSLLIPRALPAEASGKYYVKKGRDFDERFFSSTEFGRFEFQGDKKFDFCYFYVNAGKARCHRPLVAHFRAVKAAPLTPLLQEAGLPPFGELKICPAEKHPSSNSSASKP